jgi:hypothetical protein
MDFKEEGKISQRESLEQVLNSAPVGSKAYESAKTKLDQEPEIPYCLSYIWEWFWELDQTRTTDMAGPNPITFTEIQSWNHLKGIGISDLELFVLKKLDSIYLKFRRKKKK